LTFSLPRIKKERNYQTPSANNRSKKKSVAEEGTCVSDESKKEAGLLSKEKQLAFCC
jgi:hypothetical protein